MFCCYPEKEYEIEGILDEKVASDGKVLYKVKWKGYCQASWEPENNLNVPVMVQTFKVKDYVKPRCECVCDMVKSTGSLMPLNIHICRYKRSEQK